MAVDMYISNNEVLGYVEKMAVFQEMTEWFNSLENQTRNTHIIWEFVKKQIEGSTALTKEDACTVLITRFLMHTRQTNLFINSSIKLVDDLEESRRQFKLFIDSNSYQIITKLMEQGLESISLINIINNINNPTLSATYTLMN